MNELPVIPQRFIDDLVANPTEVEMGAFDGVFGEGRAAEILKQQRPEASTNTPVEPDNDLTFGQKVYDTVVQGPLTGIQNAATETGEFLVDYVGHTADYIADTTFGPLPKLVWGDGDLRIVSGEEFKAMSDKGMFSKKTSLDGLKVFDETQTIGGGLTSSVFQFGAGFLGAGKFTKLGNLKGAFVNGAIADAIVFDPDDGNLTSFLDGFADEYGVDIGPVADLLASDPDDPDYINRLRNATEGVLLGGIVEGLGLLMKARKAHKAGKEEEAIELTEEAAEALKGFDQAVAEESQILLKEAQDYAQTGEDLFGRVGIELPKNELFDEPERPIDADIPDQPKIPLTPSEVNTMREATDIRNGHSPLAREKANHGWKNLDMVDSHEEVLDSIASMRDVKAADFTKAKGGEYQSWKMVELQAGKAIHSMAKMTGQSKEAIMARFANGFSDPAQMAAELYARDSYLLSLELELAEMAKHISKGETGAYQTMEEMHLAFMQRKEVATNILAHNQSARTNIARAMRSMAMLRKGDAKLREVLKDPTAFRSGKDVKAMADAIVQNPTGSAIKTADDAFKKIHGFMDEVNSYRINALLSGSGTQEVNLVSNVINGFMLPFEQIIGGLVSGQMDVAGHGARTMASMVLSSRENVKSALKAGWMDEAILDPTNQKIEGDLANGSKGGGAFKKTTNLPSRALMTMDEFFKQAQYRGRISADAAMDAKAQGLTGEARSNFIKQYIADSYDETGAAIRGDALLQAQRSTFTEPLTGDISKMFQAAAVKSNAVRFVVPFVKTPINILSNAYQHVPIIGATSKRWQEDFAAGGVRRAQALGKWVIGASLMTTAGYLASQGLITGSGPKEPRIRKLWLEINQPYSFRTENPDGSVTFTPYSRLEPYNQVFSLVADFQEIMDDPYNQNPDGDAGAALAAMFLAVMENSVNKTFTQGLSDIFELISNPERRGDKIINSMIASFVPNAMNQLNGDELFRESRTLMDAVLAKTHLYNQVDVKRNPLGEALFRPISKADPLNIFGDAITKNDALIKEMTRVSMLTQTGFQLPHPKLRGPDGIDLSKIKHSPTQTLYDHWIELSGTIKLGGKTMRERLEEVIESSSYQRTPDGAVGVTERTKIRRIKSIIQKYREAAKNQIPELVKIDRENRRSVRDTLLEQYNDSTQEQRRNLFDNPEIQDLATPVRSKRRDDLFK